MSGLHTPECLALRDYTVMVIHVKPLTVWIMKNWKTLKEMGVPDHLTCHLRTWDAGQEATVRTPYGTTDWFRIEQGVQGCYCQLVYLYAKHIMQNGRLGELQAGIKVAGRNINNLRYANVTTLKAESKEPLEGEESEKANLKLNIKKIKIMSSSPITSWQIEGEKLETVTDFLLLGSKVTGSLVARMVKNLPAMWETWV